jgi:hypothetical protein
MVVSKKTKAIVLMLSSPTSAYANCVYQNDVESNWTKSIQSVSNVDRKVFPYVDDTRKCVMKMQVVIDGVPYPAIADYVFGPDMTENTACDKATIKAKKELIGKVSPEILPVATTQPTVKHLPVGTKTVVSSRVIDVQPVLRSGDYGDGRKYVVIKEGAPIYKYQDTGPQWVEKSEPTVPFGASFFLNFLLR